jgi:hypothetical protein
MKKKSSLLALLLVSLIADAQFYTIENENFIGKERVTVQAKKGEEIRKETNTLKEGCPLVQAPLKAKVCFDMPIHKEIAIEYDVPIFVSVRDSMMYELLGRRRSISLPLDFLKVTSEYGHRLDPITRCEN